MVGTAVETTLESMAATNIASIRPPVTRARWTVHGIEAAAAGSGGGEGLIAGKATRQLWAKRPTAGNWLSRRSLRAPGELAADHGGSHASVADHGQVAKHARPGPAQAVFHADRVRGTPGIGAERLRLGQRQARVPPRAPPPTGRRVDSEQRVGRLDRSVGTEGQDRAGVDQGPPCVRVPGAFTPFAVGEVAVGD